MIEGLPDYWLSRFVFERALAAVYLIAFLAALALTSYPQQWGTAWSAVVWAALWILYPSFVNVGQTFYAFGWESLLLETGFVAIFAGGAETTPNALLIWMWRWVLFRNMLGAGLIKLRGDPCWRDLTCLRYYFETQPIPNPLSWYFHRLPASVRRAGVAFNHLVELAVPFLYFAPQPFAAIGGFLTIAFQLMLIGSGNLSWLNWITIVLCVPTLDDRWWAWLSRPACTRNTGRSAQDHRRCPRGGCGVSQHSADSQYVVTPPADELFVRRAQLPSNVCRLPSACPETRRPIRPPPHDTAPASPDRSLR